MCGGVETPFPLHYRVSGVLSSPSNCGRGVTPSLYGSKSATIPVCERLAEGSAFANRHTGTYRLTFLHTFDSDPGHDRPRYFSTADVNGTELGACGSLSQQCHLTVPWLRHTQVFWNSLSVLKIWTSDELDNITEILIQKRNQTDYPPNDKTLQAGIITAVVVIVDLAMSVPIVLFICRRTPE
ncbi:hypothetical protein NDU88_004996 [Pleurodeles waltl]|uniref:Uncharacterized protein n=1 Tax=Pleurodeles waltl TaxID=8319 RepID=A0AAV7L2Z0_PLEWA|nr:hypothetical protein NDU88_004996 [Pleurodeles waltl]